MPATTKKMQKFIAICAHTPGKAKGKCPPMKVAEEFSHKPKGGYRKMKKRKSKSEGDNWTGRFY